MTWRIQAAGPHQDTRRGAAPGKHVRRPAQPPDCDLRWSRSCVRVPGNARPLLIPAPGTVTFHVRDWKVCDRAKMRRNSYGDRAAEVTLRPPHVCAPALETRVPCSRCRPGAWGCRGHLPGPSCPCSSAAAPRLQFRPLLPPWDLVLLGSGLWLFVLEALGLHSPPRLALCTRTRAHMLPGIGVAASLPPDLAPLLSCLSGGPGLGPGTRTGQERDGPESSGVQSPDEGAPWRSTGSDLELPWLIAPTPAPPVSIPELGRAAPGAAVFPHTPVCVCAAPGGPRSLSPRHPPRCRRAPPRGSAFLGVNAPPPPCVGH